MNIKLIKNKRPELPVCKMMCDVKINKTLDDYKLTTFLNRSQSTAIIGRPGSGKTSLLYALFKNKNPALLRDAYHNIFLFQPKESGNSMSDNIFEKNLPPENLFYELTEDTLQSVFDRIKEDNESEEYEGVLHHAIIFDDQTAHLRDNPKIKSILNELLFNRRHLHVSLFFIVQTFKSIEPSIRKLIDNYFLYKTNKQALEQIASEVIEIQSKYVIPLSNLVYDAKFNFLFINVETKTLMKNWDTIVIEED